MLIQALPRALCSLGAQGHRSGPPSCHSPGLTEADEVILVHAPVTCHPSPPHQKHHIWGCLAEAEFQNQGSSFLSLDSAAHGIYVWISLSIVIDGLSRLLDGAINGMRENTDICKQSHFPVGKILIYRPTELVPSKMSPVTRGSQLAASFSC